MTCGRLTPDIVMDATSTRKSAMMWCMLLLWAVLLHPAAAANRLSDERIIFQLGEFGQIEMALYPEARRATAELLLNQCSAGSPNVCCCPQVAPITTAHILKLAKLGTYNSCHFFRIDQARLRPPSHARCSCAGNLAGKRPAVARAWCCMHATPDAIPMHACMQGFVAQTADVISGRMEGVKLDARQQVLHFVAA